MVFHRDRRDGLSKEGCGRVAVLKYTGLIKSYTLECNYNTGCIVNIIPPTQRPLGKHLVQPLLVPPKYTPQIYEEVFNLIRVYKYFIEILLYSILYLLIQIIDRSSTLCIYS